LVVDNDLVSLELLIGKFNIFDAVRIAQQPLLAKLAET